MRGLLSKAGLVDTPGFTPTQVSSNSSLRLVSSEDGHVLLDIEHDRVLKLNTVGAEVWQSLAAGECESEIVGRLSGKYQVDQTRVAADVRALLKKFEHLGVSVQSSSTAERVPTKSKERGEPSYPWYGGSTAEKPRPSPLSVMGALIGLLLFDIILRLFSLKTLCSCVEVCPVFDRRPDRSTCGKICNAVEQATVWYPKQAVCFQRSAVTACLLRFSGLRARMMIGIRPFPLLLHSWVELSDGVVNDWRPVSQFYHTATSY